MKFIYMDVESYPNFAMVGLRIDDQVVAYTSEPGIGETFAAFRDWYAQHGRSYIWVGFNSLGYDNHIVNLILNGVDDPQVLHARSDALIENKSWRRDLLSSAGGEISVDPFCMNGGAKGLIGSLKECACKLDAPSLRTLPYTPDRYLSFDEMRNVVDYNGVDLDVTELVAKVQAEKIAARIALAREYNQLSILNVHDAKVAEIILAKQVFGSNYPSYPTVQSWALAADAVTQKFAFRTPALQELLARIPDMEFHVEIEETPDGPVKKIDVKKFADSVQVGTVTYNLGVGGLHSEDAPMLYVADDVFTFLDLDVDSFYPGLMLNHKLVAGHLPDSLLDEFDTLRQKRLQAKRSGQADLANGLKIAINSVFGKSGSAYSWLCDPCVLVQTTLLGQLTLLWLVDALTVIDGVQVVSANTDGLTLRVRRDAADVVRREMDRAAAQVDLTLAWREYHLIARRDVSNYIAVATDGSLKCKGSYSYDRTDLKKKATNRIVVDAVRDYFVNNTPVADTVRSCRDIREFLCYFKASKGYTLVDDTGTDHGTIARWYIGTTGVKLLKEKEGKAAQVPGAGGKVVLVPDLPATFPPDVDVDHYITAAEKLIKAITEPDAEQHHTIPLAELTRAQRDLLEVAKAAPADPERCGDLDRYHADWTNVVRGNRHDTMVSLLCRLWIGGAGTLSRADLLWAVDQLDEDGALPATEKRGIVDWVVGRVSPFPAPQTIAEHVAQATAWAVGHATVNKHRRPMNHDDVLRSDFVKSDALCSYERTRDVYKLACSLCAINVRTGSTLSEQEVCGIIEQIDEYLA